MGLTELEAIAFTKVTNRISDLRKVARQLGWDIKNRMEYFTRPCECGADEDMCSGEVVTDVRSWYGIRVWKGAA